ncbi:hypothetical protein NBE99_12040 [Thermosynechococcus sp. HN-54]|uniref:hypothetical protein n=1 Tax=Thermosynechococcus sp. HN-54 TaxID=2933959 RepID=UPI00202CB6E1|nr:hypothetical protein [Thermosynechococcus sp. HN-54]URR35354.1 hypothetical protein NBE99_12040 [Thermosynechococcus sp. HN-54]
MSAAEENTPEKYPGCFATSMGCFVPSILFVPCWIISAWLAFALGSMGCAVSQKYTAFQKWLKGSMGSVVFVGGGVGLPIGAGLLTHRLLKR